GTSIGDGSVKVGMFDTEVGSGAQLRMEGGGSTSINKFTAANMANAGAVAYAAFTFTSKTPYVEQGRQAFFLGNGARFEGFSGPTESGGVPGSNQIAAGLQFTHESGENISVRPYV